MFMNTLIYGIIFDFNGTLFDDTKLHIKAWQNMVQQYFPHINDIKTIFPSLLGKPNEMIIKSLSDKPLSDEEIDRLSKEKERLYRDECLKLNDKLKLRDGAIALFSYLNANNIPFTIASASIKENIDFFVDKFQLYKYLDPNKIIYDNNTYIDKTQMFLDAANTIHTDIDKILIFEDSLSGIQCGIKAGCKNIIVLYAKQLKNLYGDYPEIKLVTSDFIEVIFQLESKQVLFKSDGN